MHLKKAKDYYVTGQSMKVNESVSITRKKPMKNSVSPNRKPSMGRLSN